VDLLWKSKLTRRADAIFNFLVCPLLDGVYGA